MFLRHEDVASGPSRVALGVNESQTVCNGPACENLATTVCVAGTRAGLDAMYRGVRCWSHSL
jgi:hypothetical protein